jgi:hypothetical protein
MVLKGLDAYGKFDFSHEIACTHLDAAVEVFKETGTLFENYAPVKQEGKFAKGGTALSDFVGWTGLIPISVMFEYVFGIKPDASNNVIKWYVNLTDRHGVEKYPFGTEGELTLICEARKDASEEPVITASSNIPVTLEVIWNGKTKRIEL